MTRDAGLARVIETCLFTCADGAQTTTGHTLATAYDGTRLYVSAVKGGAVVGTFWVRVDPLDGEER